MRATPLPAPAPVPPRPNYPPAWYTALSRSERAVCDLLVRGLTYRQIAARIGRTHHTVRNAVALVLRKAAVPDARALAVHYWVALYRPSPDASAWYGRLPPRQRQTCDLLVRGFSYEQVAGTLGIALPTVRRHTEAVFVAAGVYGTLGLTILYWGGEVLERRPADEQVTGLDVIASRAPDWANHVRHARGC